MNSINKMILGFKCMFIIRYLFYQILQLKRFFWARIAIAERLILVPFFYFVSFAFLSEILLLKDYIVINETA